MPSSACHVAIRNLSTFPTRRSSDLAAYNPGHYPDDWLIVPATWPKSVVIEFTDVNIYSWQVDTPASLIVRPLIPDIIAAWYTDNWEDRKSTRLNSSHLGISYAVFCLSRRDP